ncbi:MAG: nicotinamide mononucleotide transporter [Candidatus Omnitrophica bacterium]|nr:nicotinamide mononucleotide transporter [Candidatus Omnitrophota bacterium]
MADFFSINNVFFTFLGYQMSYLEFFGTIFNIWSVWLVMRNNIWTWPIGNIAVILFCFLFYQIRLYSDLFEQVYFFIIGFYGWWAWLYLKGTNKINGKRVAPITYNSLRSNMAYAAIIIVGTIAMGHAMGNIHLYLPKWFPCAASFPYLDAFTTVMSFAATILMARKKIECWYLWILVDIIGIGLYFAKAVIFVSLLYVIFLILAYKGLLNWQRIYKNQVRIA